ncbi:MAG: HEAT repeat domain-containing protein [Verrucomicrobiota bacterium]
MARKYQEEYEAETTASGTIVEAYRLSLDSDDVYSGISLAVVHYRGGQTEFDLGCYYAASQDALDRVTGADVLAQLGWGDDCFHDPSVEVLLRLVGDMDERVIVAAAYALGHRRSERGNPVVLPLIYHTNAEVRYAVVHALTGQEEGAALAGLIVLAGDADRDVRNWAAFGLGTISDMDTPGIREALARLLDEPDAEIRGEALIGLAKRHDPRAAPALLRELAGPFHGNWCLEAAELLSRPELLPLLLELRAKICPKDEAAFSADLDQAIAACSR